MSFPLPQDVGYDPSLYTAKRNDSSVLVRDVTARGQRVLRVGMVRPLAFHATPTSVIRIAYVVAMCGEVKAARLILGSVDGHRYTAVLPGGNGAHAARVDGRQLHIPAQGADIQVIVLETEVAQARLDSHNRLTLKSFEINAERPPVLRLEEPALESSPVDGRTIARVVVTAAHPLAVQLSGGAAASVEVSDEAGKRIRTLTIPQGSGTRVPILQADATTPLGLYRITVSRGSARVDFHALLLSAAPGHPRVLLSSERLEQLRSQSYSNELLAIVRRRAADLRKSIAYNSEAGQNIARLPTVSPFPGLPDYFALMESYSHAIAFNALEFRISGDAQGLEAARRALLTVSAWPTWTPPWFQAQGLHTYYEVGVFMQRVAFGYDLVADQLTPQEKAQIAEAFWRNGIRPTLQEYFFSDRLPIAASNHMAQSVGGSIGACVALYGDVPDWESRFGPALAELILAYERMLKGLFPGDGSEAEPAGYENFAMEGLSWGMAALHALGIRPHGYEKMMQAFWWPRYAQVRPDLVLDSGDFGSELRGHSGYAWGAEFAGEPALQAFYETATDRSLMGVFSLRHTGRILEEAPGLLDLVCCTRPAVAVPTPPPSRVFPGRGSALLRSGWSPQDTVISIRVGPWFNHEHHDQGSFRVAAFGEELVAEGGYADYYRDPHYPDYFTQASAHNTVLINEDAFSQEDYDGRYWAAFRDHARFSQHLFSSAMDYLAADLAPAYRDGSGLKQFTREWLFIKPDVLIVRDRLQAAVPNVYTWLLHVPPGSHAVVEAHDAVIHGKGAFVTLTRSGKAGRWILQPTPIPTIAYGNLDRIHVEPRQAFYLDSGPPANSGVFLVGMRFQKATEQPASLRAFSSASGEGFQTPDRRTTLFFRVRPGALSVGDLSADGDALAVINQAEATDIFAENLRSIERRQQAVFSSSAPVDVVMRKTSAAEEFHIACTSETDLKIRAERKPAELTLDGAKVVPQAGEIIVFPQLAKGEHVVRVSY
jgi:hypothetical protein